MSYYVSTKFEAYPSGPSPRQLYLVPIQIKLYFT